MDIAKIISQMTLEDKIALCEGANFWESRTFGKYGIPSMFVCDGPSGLRKQDISGGADMLGVNDSLPATCFPASVTTASSWDEALLQRIGRAIGEEARQQGVGVVLGPGANLKRNPLRGRNFEYFSEDPYLTGKMAAGFIRGVESWNVGTSLKHFAANSQELSRFTSDSMVDARTLRERKPTQSDWERMTGRTYTAPVLKKGPFTMDNTVLEMMDDSLIMRLMAKVTEQIIARSNGGKVDYENPEFRMMINASLGGPLRSMQISGAVRGGIFPGLLDMANGHVFRGLWRMITNR